MKLVYLISITFFLFQTAFSSGSNIHIKGTVITDMNYCENEIFYFYIPVEVENIEEGYQFSINLASPQDSKVNCRYIQNNQIASSLSASDFDYLKCSYAVGNTLIYHKLFSFMEEYDWSELPVNMEDWDVYLGDNPIIGDSVTCPIPIYEFTQIKLNTLTDNCDLDEPEYHIISLKGSLVENELPNLLTASDINFHMTIKVNSTKDVSAECNIQPIKEENSSEEGVIFCKFKGDGIVNFINQMDPIENKNYAYIESTESFNLKYFCSSSYLTLSLFILLSLLF